MILKKEYVVQLLHLHNLVILILLIIHLTIIKKKCFLPILCILQQKLVACLMAYLVIFEKEDCFVHYLHFLQVIFQFVGKKKDEKRVFFVILLDTTTYDKYGINNVLYIFRR